MIKWCKYIVLSILLAGCKPSWYPDRKVETDDERKAVSALESTLLSRIPSTLSGHDQDWDDAIQAAHSVSVETVCKTRQYEWQPEFGGGHYTGKYREIDNQEVK